MKIEKKCENEKKQSDFQGSKKCGLAAQVDISDFGDQLGNGTLHYRKPRSNLFEPLVKVLSIETRKKRSLNLL